MGVLRLEGVTKRYGYGRRVNAVLDDVWMEVGPDEVVGLFGLRRSGKSTLLRVAAGVEQPDEGRVLLGDADLARGSVRTRTRLTRRVGLVAAVPGFDGRSRLGHTSVVDRVALPLVGDGISIEEATARGYEMLHRVGLGHCAEAALAELGPGESTRASIARVLLADPEILLVDEPAVTPSPNEWDEIRELLHSLASPECGLLIASEHTGAIRGCDRALLIRDGRVVSSRGTLVPFPLSPASRAGMAP